MKSICSKLLWVTAFVILDQATCPQDAYAYLDAGTGSIILQAIIGGFLAALFTIKMYWRKMMSIAGQLFAGRSCRRK